jgi:hypothetical protein
MQTLYLIQARAAGTYLCDACSRPIPQGRSHFRHDPHPYARLYRGEKTRHFCRDCISGAEPGPPDRVTGRIRVPAVRVIDSDRPANRTEKALLEPMRIELIGIAPILMERLAADPRLVHGLSASDFEDFICDRLHAMGLEPRKTGSTNQKDGGVDIVFWPRAKGAFPFVGAAQVKHHRDPLTAECPGTVRNFAGAISGHPFTVAILVTNTSFSADAQWFADAQTRPIRLRDYRDVRRWIQNRFDDDAEWREIPSSITLCPGVVVKIRE